MKQAPIVKERRGEERLAGWQAFSFRTHEGEGEGEEAGRKRAMCLRYGLRDTYRNRNHHDVHGHCNDHHGRGYVHHRLQQEPHRYLVRV